LEIRSKKQINNAYYNDLNERWIEAIDHPIALLRSENALRNPWIQEKLAQTFENPCSVLDIGCGGGFLTNYLAKKEHRVVGVDLSEQSLAIAKKFDETNSVDYRRASAYQLPFADASFDAVCAMDLLEHVENPSQVIREASRVLRKGGLFFFHTFNRNILSYFLIIKGIDWCFSNPPKNIHVYPLFIKPDELRSICENQQLLVKEIQGVRPSFSNLAFWKLVFTQKVKQEFRFRFTPSLKTGYCGYAIRD